MNIVKWIKHSICHLIALFHCNICLLIVILLFNHVKYYYVVAPNCTVPILNNGNITWRGFPLSAAQVPVGSILTYKCDAGFIPNFVELMCGADGLLDAGNNPPLCSGIYIYIYKQIETDAQNRSCPDRESNHGSPAYIYIILPPGSISI